MKSRALLFIVAVVCILSLISCGGVQNQTNDIVVCQDEQGNYYAISSDGKTFLFYYPGNTAESFTVPDGIEVVSKGSFTGTENLKELTFSPTVKTIESGFFEYACFEKVIIPETVESVEYDFFNCPNLKELVCAAPMEKFHAVIGSPELESLMLPSTIIEWGDYAFDAVPNLKVISVYGQVLQTDENFEKACGGIVLYIPNGIKNVTVEMLLGTNASGYYIPDSVETLDIRGTGSWGRPMTFSVSPETEILSDGDGYHTVIVRGSVPK